MTLLKEILQGWKFPSLLAVLALVLFGAAPASADCADAPAPGVDWRRCTMHARQFVGADLTGARLKDGRFTRSDFSGANLNGADLRRTKFIAARLVGAQMQNVRLQGADLTKADLSGADLSGANLARAQFQGAVLRGVNLTGASLRDTNMQEADLSAAIWIDGKTMCAEGSISTCRQMPILKKNGGGG